MGKRAKGPLDGVCTAAQMVEAFRSEEVRRPHARKDNLAESPTLLVLRRPTRSIALPGRDRGKARRGALSMAEPSVQAPVHRDHQDADACDQAATKTGDRAGREPNTSSDRFPLMALSGPSAITLRRSASDANRT